MNSKNLKTLRAIYTDPVPSTIRWDDIETLLRYLEADITEGRGSRVRVRLNNIRGTFHEPHPRPQVCKCTVLDVREFLIAAGISKPNNE